MATPTPQQLEARLAYFVPRLAASAARLEARAAALAAATLRPLPKKRWFAALLRARDALELHANGDLRQLNVDMSRLPYSAKRLVVARYYKDGKRYSGESEDDANEAQRRLEAFDRGDRFELQLDAIEQRKRAAADVIKRSQAKALEILGRDSSLETEYPREELRHGTTRLKRGDDLGGAEVFSEALPARGRLRRHTARDASDSDGEGIDALKRRTGHDPDKLARGAAALLEEDAPCEVVRPDIVDVDVDLEALEERGDWAALERAARGCLHADPVDAGRALGRALGHLDREEEALAAFAAALARATEADAPDDAERVLVDRGRLYLDRGEARDDPLEQRDCALRALHEFEASRDLYDMHKDAGGAWPDALCRARYNAGLAFDLAEKRDFAAREFEAAAQGFGVLLRGDRADRALLGEMRGRALVYAGDDRLALDDEGQAPDVNGRVVRQAAVAAVLFERAVVCLAPVAARCTGVLLDALWGVALARKRTGDADGAKRAARHYVSAGGDPQDIDDEASDNEVVDLTRFEVKDEFANMGDDMLAGELSQRAGAEEPLECLGAFSLRGPLAFPEREPDAPGDALRRRFVHLPIPTGVTVYDGKRPAKRRRGAGRGGGGGPVGGHCGGGGPAKRAAGGAGGPDAKRARREGATRGDNHGFAQRRRPSAAPTKGRRRRPGAAPARRRPAAAGGGGCAVPGAGNGAGRGPPVPRRRLATDDDGEAEFEFGQPAAPPRPPAASSSDDSSSGDDVPLAELQPRTAAAPRAAPRSPRGVDTLAARLGLLSHREAARGATLALGGADARTVAAAARRAPAALELRFCRGGAALAAAAGKAARLTALTLTGCGLALDELAPLEGRLPHVTRADLSANPLGRRPASAHALGAGARALEALAFRCDALELAQVCVAPRGPAYPFHGGDAVASALARGLRKRNAPPARIGLADNAFTVSGWRDILAALALRPPSKTLDVSRPAVLDRTTDATWARDLGGAVRSASTICLDDADALALHAGRPSSRGVIESLSVTGRTAATELAAVLAARALSVECDRVAPHAILTSLGRSEVLQQLSVRGCRLDARRIAALLCAPKLVSLDAAGNDASADATVDLAACLKNPRLRRVDLSRNGFDPGQRARLVAAFGAPPPDVEAFVLERDR